MHKVRFLHETKYNNLFILHSSLRERPYRPSSALCRHFHCRQSPILSVIVTLVLPSTNARTLQRLVVGEGRQNAKNHWNASVQLNPHEGMRNTVTNILKVHGGTLDENTDRDDCIEWGFG